MELLGYEIYPYGRKGHSEKMTDQTSLWKKFSRDNQLFLKISVDHEIYV